MRFWFSSAAQLTAPSFSVACSCLHRCQYLPCFQNQSVTYNTTDNWMAQNTTTSADQQASCCQWAYHCPLASAVIVSQFVALFRHLTGEPPSMVRLYLYCPNFSVRIHRILSRNSIFAPSVFRFVLRSRKTRGKVCRS